MNTIFIDFDGCIINHPDNYLDTHDYNYLQTDGKKSSLNGCRLLEGSREKLLDWFCEGHTIIITTGRPEGFREELRKFLSVVGIYYHQLVMSCGAGPRYLINDIDPAHKDQEKAIAINLTRNEGISKIELNKDDSATRYKSKYSDFI